MSKANVPEEVEVLRFFEEAPIEQAELLFNIVKAKMRVRLAEKGPAEKPKKKHSAAKEVRGVPLGEEAGVTSPQA